MNSAENNYARLMEASLRLLKAVDMAPPSPLMKRSSWLAAETIRQREIEAASEGLHATLEAICQDNVATEEVEKAARAQGILTYLGARR